MTPDEFWANRFHACALAAGCIAYAEGRIGDSHYVQKLAYDMFESGVFRDPRPTADSSSTPYSGSLADVWHGVMEQGALLDSGKWGLPWPTRWEFDSRSSPW